MRSPKMKIITQRKLEDLIKYNNPPRCTLCGLADSVENMEVSLTKRKQYVFFHKKCFDNYVNEVRNNAKKKN